MSGSDHSEAAILNAIPAAHSMTARLDANSVADLAKEITGKAVEPINFFWLGQQPYQPVWSLQQRLHRLQIEGSIRDTVLLLEHDHVYTLGKNADENHLLPSYPRDAEVIRIDRGGDITYHGPGQLVGYPIIDLHRYRQSVSWYMRSLEEVIIQTLGAFNLQCRRKEGLPGVWTEDEKICAMGVRLSRWITMHGFALNVAPDMSYFTGMIPCGIFEFGVTSIAQQTSPCPDMTNVIEHFCRIFKRIFIENLNHET